MFGKMSHSAKNVIIYVMMRAIRFRLTSLNVRCSRQWYCFGIFDIRSVAKLAHTHRFEHEHVGLKSKHLTTRPRTPEMCCATCQMKRELSPGKKASALSHNNGLSQV